MTYLDRHPLSGAFLANRLDRLADLIATQGDAMLHDAALDIPSRAVSLMLLIGDHGQLSAADIANLIDQPHQLVSQRAELLMKNGLVERRDDPDDGRRKIMALTDEGQSQYTRLQRRLAEAASAFDALFNELDGDLSALVTRAMQVLSEKPLLERIKTSAAQTGADNHPC